MNKKILITGIAGLIGSNISSLMKGYDIYGLDIYRNYLKNTDLETDDNIFLKYERFRKKKLKNVKKIYYIDPRNNFEIFNLIKSLKPKVIIHLAALPLSNISHSISQETFSSIYNSTYNILESIRLIDNKIKFIYTSSSMVYGNFINPLVTENDNTDPLNAYGSAKLCGEVLVKGFAKTFNIKSIIIRPSAVYGPTDINRRVVQNFLFCALGNQRISINDKSLVLDFTYVDDIAMGFIKCVQYFNKMKSDYEIFNITSSDPSSLYDLFLKFKFHFPKLKNPIYKKREKYVPKRGGLDISKAKKLIGFKPQYSLEKGISKYIKIEKKIRNG